MRLRSMVVCARLSSAGLTDRPTDRPTTVNSAGRETIQHGGRTAMIAFALASPAGRGDPYESGLRQRRRPIRRRTHVTTGEGSRRCARRVIASLSGRTGVRRRLRRTTRSNFARLVVVARSSPHGTYPSLESPRN